MRPGNNCAGNGQKEPKWKMKNLKSVQDRGNYGNGLKQGLCTEVVVRRCSVKKVFLQISQNSQENTCARFSFLGLQIY